MMARRVMGRGGAPSSFDSDALAYLSAVETADGEALEPAVRSAVNDFVVGCKSDGIWDAIKASCILAGARTLNGALVPLKGAAPTNTNYVSVDYNRKTGLIGANGKKLRINRYINDDPINNCHFSNYLSSGTWAIASSASGGGVIVAAGNPVSGRFRNTTYINGTIDFSGKSFIGCARTESTSFTVRSSDLVESLSAASVAANASTEYYLNEFSTSVYANSRCAFYSIGESIDLEKLDTRVTALIAAIGAAI